MLEITFWNISHAETMGVFSKKFANAYSSALIEKVKEDNGMGKKNEYQLVDAPKQTEVLREGYMIKRGALRKNWKKRWFVACNEDKNFAIEYYTDKNKKKKGQMDICG